MANEVTTRPQRQAVMAAEPIFDTAQFEHMARIATMIGTSSLLPAHLRVMRDKDGREVALNKQDTVDCWLDEKATVANAFLIVSAARNFGGMDPFALAQSSYFVHGRLGYEGKLVQAMIERRVGSMDFEYNQSNPNSEDFGITVTAWVPNSNPEKRASVSGTVREWASRKQGTLNQQWKGEAGARRMLHYRGTREWARLYAPALVLGLLDDDDLEHMREDLRARTARQIEGPARRFNPLADDGALEIEAPKGEVAGSVADQVNDLGRGRLADQLGAVVDTLTTEGGRTVEVYDRQTGEISPEAAQDGGEQGEAAGEAVEAATAAGSAPEAAGETKAPTKRLPRGFSQKVDWARLEMSKAKNEEQLGEAWIKHARPLVHQIETEGLPRPSIERLTEMLDKMRAQFAAVISTHTPGPVATGPDHHPTADQEGAAHQPKPAQATGDVSAYQVQLDHLRDELAAAQTFEDVDDVVDATTWLGDGTPANIMGLADDLIGERREAIGTANAQAAEAPQDPQQVVEPAPTALALQEMADKWVGDMRKIGTVAALDAYNVEHITPFMQGPHAHLLDRDDLENAKQTFASRRRLLVKREEDAAS